MYWPPRYFPIIFESCFLADVLEITIKDGEKTLYHDTAAHLGRRDVETADDFLRVNEETGNSAQNLTLTFDLCADAVQTKNNPNKLFE